MKPFAFFLFVFMSISAGANPLESIEPPYTIIIRTPSASLGTDIIRPATSLPECQDQRRLDERGVEQIDSLEKTFRNAGLISTVYASEYCRSYQAAAKIFPQLTVRVESFLNDACFHAASINQKNQEQFEALIRNATAPQVILAHNCNVRMLFSNEIQNKCQASGRLEASQWMVVKAKGDELTVIACSELPN